MSFLNEIFSTITLYIRNVGKYIFILILHEYSLSRSLFLFVEMFV